MGGIQKRILKNSFNLAALFGFPGEMASFEYPCAQLLKFCEELSNSRVKNANKERQGNEHLELGDVQIEERSHNGMLLELGPVSIPETILQMNGEVSLVGRSS
jgi:hypothetical protein